MIGTAMTAASTSSTCVWAGLSRQQTGAQKAREHNARRFRSTRGLGTSMMGTAMTAASTNSTCSAHMAQLSMQIGSPDVAISGHAWESALVQHQGLGHQHDGHRDDCSQHQQRLHRLDSADNKLAREKLEREARRFLCTGGLGFSMVGK